MTYLKSILFSAVITGFSVTNLQSTFAPNPYLQGENSKNFYNDVAAKRTHNIAHQVFPKMTPALSRAEEEQLQQQKLDLQPSFSSTQYVETSESYITSFPQDGRITYTDKLICYKNNLPQENLYLSAKFTDKFIAWYNMCFYINNRMNGTYSEMQSNDFLRYMPDLHQEMQFTHISIGYCGSALQNALLLVESTIYNYEKALKGNISLESLFRVTLNTMRDLYFYIEQRYNVKIYDTLIRQTAFKQDMWHIFQESEYEQDPSNPRQAYVQKFYNVMMSTNTNNVEKLKELKIYLTKKLY